MRSGILREGFFPSVFHGDGFRDSELESESRIQILRIAFEQFADILSDGSTRNIAYQVLGENQMIEILRGKPVRCGKAEFAALPRFLEPFLNVAAIERQRADMIRQTIGSERGRRDKR